MNTLVLHWDEVRKIFHNDNFQEIKTDEGVSLNVKKISDTEKWIKNKYDPIWENNGILIIFCRENQQKYKCHYTESGSDINNTEMFNGWYFFDKI